MTAREQIKRHEGLRLSPYLDCCGATWRDCTCAVKGHLTIGYGHNLDDKPIPKEVADLLFESDYLDTESDLSRHLPWAADVNEPRRGVLLNMAYNLGAAGLVRFRRMLAALQATDYNLASVEMLDSQWAGQVGPRARELAEQMRSGVWQGR